MLKLHAPPFVYKIYGDLGIWILAKNLDGNSDLPAARAMVAIGAPAVPALIVALRDGDSEVRERAARALVNIGVPAVHALIVALGDRNSGVRWRAARALGQIAQTHPEYDWKLAVPALIVALGDGDSDVSRRALVNIGTPAVPVLIVALGDRNSGVRWGAAEALVAIGTPAVPALIVALGDGNSNVRARAADALGEIAKRYPEFECDQAVSALNEKLEDKDPWVQKMAANAIHAIETSRASVLIRDLGDDDPWRRRYAASRLGEGARAVNNRLNLRDILMSLARFVKSIRKRGDKCEIMDSEKEALEIYTEIAKAVQESKTGIGLGYSGETVDGSIKAPKARGPGGNGDMFRTQSNKSASATRPILGAG